MVLGAIWYNAGMSKKAEKILNQMNERVASWSEDDLEMLDSAASHIEAWRAGEYEPTEDELRSIDRAMAEIDRGQLATPEQVEAAFAKFRATPPDGTKGAGVI